MPVCFETAVAEPALLLAVMANRSVLPTSVGTNVCQETAEPWARLTQFNPAASQRSQS
jgi:hypothetical protein